MPWPFPIDWTDLDTRAVIQNVIASVAVIGVADALLRGLLSVVFGTRPRLAVEASASKAYKDVDWPHLIVRNKGLPFSPRTRAAEGVTAYGTLDGVAHRFQWSTSDARAPAQVDIYGGRAVEIPMVVRFLVNAMGTLYDNMLMPQTAYLSEVEFLTQGHPGKIGPTPLTNGTHELTVVVQALDGTTTSARFRVNVPPWPGPITLHKR